MYISLFVGVLCAVFFFRAAAYEGIGSAGWAIASLGLTTLVSLRGGGLLLVLVSQVALFALMWWYNVRRKNRMRR
jgi:hypothetical protein